MNARELILQLDFCAVVWMRERERFPPRKPLSYLSPPVVGRRADPRVMKAGELALPLIAVLLERVGHEPYLGRTIELSLLVWVQVSWPERHEMRRAGSGSCWLWYEVSYPEKCWRASLSGMGIQEMAG